ncbi:uncharacterized protein [Amphiura filiformis]|uniref:uncharacterized protein n=1 Tax=Amphiura filiformis TaxID=82378 RepID=UPI003B220F1E
MALMTRCCCWNVHTGSLASGIYTLVSVLLTVFYYIYQFVVVGKTKAKGPIEAASSDAYGNSVAAMSGIGFLINLYIIIACIILFIGVNRDKKWMLIPFMIGKTLQLFLFAVSFFVFVYAIVVKPSIDASLILYLCMAIPFVVLDVLCLLCVISLYQVYVEGIQLEK